MKAKIKIATALIGSFILGLGAASVLRAQAKPPAYVDRSKAWTTH
jgi:hypothetical protein